MKIVYVLESVVNDREIRRLGMDVVLERGWDLTVLDVADITYPTIPRNRDHYDQITGFALRQISNRQDLKREEATLAGADVIINLMMTDAVTRLRLPILRAISRANRPVMTWNGPLVPGWTKNVFWRRVVGRPAHGWRIIRRKDWINSIIFRIPPSWLGVRPSTWILEAGWGRRTRLRGPATRMIPAHAPDYDIYLQNKAAGWTDKNQAVFIDQNLPHHHDFSASGTQSVDPDLYYRNLRDFFDLLERTYGLEVVIAAHPRADHHKRPGAFGNRSVQSGVVAWLVMESRLVLTHSSTALGFAVMARKPAFAMLTRDLARVGNARHFAEELSKELGAPLLYIDDEALALPEVFSVDNAAYDRYMRTYIKAPDSPQKSLWDIAFDQIEHDLATSRSR